jgi:hypothetical protein
MFIEILPKVGGTPVRLEASQVLLLLDNGSPVMVAGEYGAEGFVKCAHAMDADFQQVLRALGYKNHQVVVDILETTPPPRGARVVAGPGLQR